MIAREIFIYGLWTAITLYVFFFFLKNIIIRESRIRLFKDHDKTYPIFFLISPTPQNYDGNRLMETASEIVQNHDAYLNLRRSNLKITLIDLNSFKSTKEKKKKIHALPKMN